MFAFPSCPFFNIFLAFFFSFCYNNYIMKFLTIDEVIAFQDNSCPYCGQTLDYEDGNLLCWTCHRAWNYSYVKSCRIAYEENPYTYPNLSSEEK